MLKWSQCWKYCQVALARNSVCLNKAFMPGTFMGKAVIYAAIRADSFQSKHVHPSVALSQSQCQSLLDSSNLTTWDYMTGSDKRLNINSLCQVLMKPSDHSTPIRLAVASWILNDEIQMSQLIDWHQFKKALSKGKPSLKILRRTNVEWSLTSASKQVCHSSIFLNTLQLLACVYMCS